MLFSSLTLKGTNARPVSNVINVTSYREHINFPVTFEAKTTVKFKL